MENKEIVGYIPNLLYKFYLRLKEKFDPTPPPKEEELYCVDICKNLILNQKSKLTIAPVSNKRYIKSDDNDMFIVIHNRVISLINHVYSYNVYIENDKLYAEVINNFDNELEKRRGLLEDEIKSNIKHSLKSILDKVTQNSPSVPV